MARDKGFRVFDIYTGAHPTGRYLDFAELTAAVRQLGLETVPVLYQGPHSEAALLEHRDGRDSISGSHVREGVVITTLQETWDNGLGRVKLKAVSPEYMFRKGNQTEFN